MEKNTLSTTYQDNCRIIAADINSGCLSGFIRF